MGGGRSSPTRPIICHQPTTLSALAIFYIGREIHGRGRTRCIGAKPSGDSRTESRLISTNFWNEAPHFRARRYPLIYPPILPATHRPPVHFSFICHPPPHPPSLPPHSPPIARHT